MSITDRPSTRPITTDISKYRWPDEGVSRLPYWIYTDATIYAAEEERIFGGPHWNYVALEAEIPNPGDYKRSFVGERSVVVARGKDREVSVFVNKCSHRGAQFCQTPLGNTQSFTCPYHQWSFSLNGTCIGVPFRKGLKGKGGFAADFDPHDHNLQKLAVAVRGGVVFASFDLAMTPLDAYLGPVMLPLFDREFDGRELEILGYSRQRIPGNWKLIIENLIDPYHTALLHTFFATFGLFRPDQPSSTVTDASGMHSAQITVRGKQVLDESTTEMKNFRESLKLEDPRLLDTFREFAGEPTAVMAAIWPSVILQQQSNTLATRHIVPRGPNAFDLHWTFFGYAGEADDLRKRRLMQANLMGPGGYISMEDGEIIGRQQSGFEGYMDDAAVVELGGEDRGNTDHMVTEGLIRALYHGYRKIMGL